MRNCKEQGCNKEKAPGRSRCYACYGRIRRNSGPKRCTIQPTTMKVLFIDIETQPNLAWVWSIWNQNIGINQLADSVEMMCFAAKWQGSDEIMFHDNRQLNRRLMVEAAWDLLNEANVVIHFYGSRFDIPHLNREFLENGFPPPSPFKQIDLKMVASKRFKFPSNKLQYISQALGLAGKVEHEGFPLWEKCMKGDPEAWGRMEEYNRQDVVLLEEVYEILLPWVPGHPSRYLYDGVGGCPTCGAESVVEAGIAYTALSRFNQWRCEDCGAYFRSSRRLDGVRLQESVL